jgi:hypothetical protein
MLIEMLQSGKILIFALIGSLGQESLDKVGFRSVCERPLLAESCQKLRLVGQEVLYYPSLRTQVSSSSERYALSIGMNT